MGRVVFLIGLLLAAGRAEEVRFDLAGQITPEARASISLHGATSPFSVSTLSDSRGRFQFRKLLAGAYTIGVFIPGRGETSRTIEVGPSVADAKGRVTVNLDLRDSKLLSTEALRRRSLISANELKISDRARKEYAEAQKCLSRRDVPGAVARLEQAVKLAPQFSAAWNNLGTIAYQSGDYARAERHFREALEQDPEAFAPLVNLGGVLLNLDKLEEGLKYNLYAVLTRPQDALANSQLGMNYFALGDLERGQKYLTVAKQIDPAHFSHPQLTLAEIHLRKGNRGAAADELEDFLKYHPDWPQAAKMREGIEKLRR
ncbi:MAG: tetratricopeptide repeat protein [Acidobacteria bacterium]|nr:tetratricopeptide repeat protein [Acidobacteriota bacterium]